MNPLTTCPALHPVVGLVLVSVIPIPENILVKYWLNVPPGTSGDHGLDDGYVTAYVIERDATAETHRAEKSVYRRKVLRGRRYLDIGGGGYGGV